MSMMDAGFRKLPLFRGKERMAKLIFKKQIAESKNILIRGKFGCGYFIPNIVENVGFDIFINGIYEQETSDYIVDHLPEKGVFLDLGANIGAVTIPVQARRKDVSIVCVEAAPWIFNCLKKNLEFNGAVETIAVNRALFDTDDEILKFYAPQEKFGKGSLSPVFTDKEVSVVTVKLDSLIKELEIGKVDLIKIDVEGYEYHVFTGAASLLGGPDAPDIIFEFVDWAEEQAINIKIGDSQQILQDMGYRIYYFNGKGIMKEVDGILNKGFHMLFASKKYLH